MLAEQLRNAIEQIGRQAKNPKGTYLKSHQGFFYITNFGLSQDEVDLQFAIGREFFALSTEEKLKYRADLENGGYNGYKPRGLREIVPGMETS